MNAQAELEIPVTQFEEGRKKGLRDAADFLRHKAKLARAAADSLDRVYLETKSNRRLENAASANRYRCEAFLFDLHAASIEGI